MLTPFSCGNTTERQEPRTVTEGVRLEVDPCPTTLRHPWAAAPHAVCSPADSNHGIGHGCRCSWTLLPRDLKLKGNVRQASPVRSEGGLSFWHERTWDGWGREIKEVFLSLSGAVCGAKPNTDLVLSENYLWAFLSYWVWLFHQFPMAYEMTYPVFHPNLVFLTHWQQRNLWSHVSSWAEESGCLHPLMGQETSPKLHSAFTPRPL